MAQTAKPYLLLTLLCAFLYLAGIATIPITDRDSAHFAQASRQMLETNQYFQVNFQNKPRHLKPPGIYWLQALSVKIFSDAESIAAWPYRLPSVLGAWLAVLFTFYFARRFYPEKVALVGAGFLASSLLLIIESHLMVTDAVLLLSMVWMQGALWQIYVKHRQEEPIHWRWPLLFWLAMSAGILIKGITPLVGFLTLFSLAIVDRSFSMFKATRFFSGFLFTILLTAAWLIPLSLSSHSNFLWNMIHGDVLPKLVGGQESHGMPPGYFVLIFILMFWPGALFVWHGNMWGWNQRHSPTERFLFAWIWPTWIFFALVPTKLPQYILPVYPAISILTALGIYHWRENRWHWLMAIGNKLQYGFWGLYGVSLVVALITIPYILLKSIPWISFFSAVILLGTMVFALVCIYKQQLLRAAYVTILGFSLGIMPVFQWLLPSLQPLWLSQRVILAIKQHGETLSAQKPLLSIGYSEPSLVFLTGTKKVNFVDGTQAIKALRQGAKLALVNQKSAARFLKLANKAKLDLTNLTSIHGYNYNDGRWVTLKLYAR